MKPAQGMPCAKKFRIKLVNPFDFNAESIKKEDCHTQTQAKPVEP